MLFENIEQDYPSRPIGRAINYCIEPKVQMEDTFKGKKFQNRYFISITIWCFLLSLRQLENITWCLICRLVSHNQH